MRFSVEVSGLDRLEKFSSRIGQLLSHEYLISRVIVLASEAGHALRESAIRACMEAIYDQPEGEYVRTQALLNAHRLTEAGGGLIQVVDVDPFATVEDQHSGREFVEDYATYVHDGYTQWVFGTDTGEFHPGKFWFDVTYQESFPIIISFLHKAWSEIITEIVHEAAA